MGLRLLAALTAVVVLHGTVFVSAVRSQDTENSFLSSLLSGIASSLEAEQQDKAILRVFKDELGREPSEREMRRYRTLMQEDHWTEGDVRDDLRDRGDYRRHSRRAYEDPDKVVRRAYQDILHRDPDPEGLRTYRSKMSDEDWTEHDVREALRTSPEHDERSGESADKIVRRAYEDILGRQPDQSGMATYRNKIVHQGWDEHDVREDLKRSSEYRQSCSTVPPRVSCASFVSSTS